MSLTLTLVNVLLFLADFSGLKACLADEFGGPSPPLEGSRITIVASHMAAETSMFTIVASRFIFSTENYATADETVGDYLRCIQRALDGTDDATFLINEGVKAEEICFQTYMNEGLDAFSEEIVTALNLCPLVMSGVATNMTISVEQDVGCVYEDAIFEGGLKQEAVADVVVSDSDVLVMMITSIYKGNIVVVHVKKKMKKNKAIIFNMDLILELNSIVLRNTRKPSLMWSWICRASHPHVVTEAMLELWRKRWTINNLYALYENLEEKKVPADLHLPKLMPAAAAAAAATEIEEETKGLQADHKVSDKKRIVDMVVEACSLFVMVALRVIKASKVSINLSGPKVSIDVSLAAVWAN